MQKKLYTGPLMVLGFFMFRFMYWQGFGYFPPISSPSNTEPPRCQGRIHYLLRRHITPFDHFPSKTRPPVKEKIIHSHRTKPNPQSQTAASLYKQAEYVIVVGVSVDEHCVGEDEAGPVDPVVPGVVLQQDGRHAHLCAGLSTRGLLKVYLFKIIKS